MSTLGPSPVSFGSVRSNASWWTERDSAAKMKATTVVVNSSHVVMISKPDSVANFILQAIATLNEC